MNNQAPEGVLKSPLWASCGLLTLGASLSLYHCAFGPILDWSMPKDPAVTVGSSIVALLVVGLVAYRRSRRSIVESGGI